MEEEATCHTGLSLGLGWGAFVPRRDGQQQQQQHKPPVLFHVLFPPRLKEEVVNEEHDTDGSSSKTIDEEEVNPIGNHNSTSTNIKNSTRKKLRLTKDQSTLLEESFKEHPTLNPTQKQELAMRLNLEPRQVEVWFQNRRARTKLKQTEVDCEFLKKCCESLSDENRRLKKELQELRSIKLGSSAPFYIQLPKSATLTMCPSCERIAKTGDGKSTTGNGKSSNKMYSGIDDSTLAC